jgi:hypothetical protein
MESLSKARWNKKEKLLRCQKAKSCTYLFLKDDVFAPRENNYFFAETNGQCFFPPRVQTLGAT